MNNGPGTIALTGDGDLHISAGDDQYWILREDARNLLFLGKVAPLVQPEDDDEQRLAIEGHAAINSPGKAVTIHTRSAHYIIPLVSLRRVARGEATSALILPLAPAFPEAFE